MRTVYSKEELEKYLKDGETIFVAGNKKMEVAFRVYKALGHDGSKMEGVKDARRLAAAVTGGTIIAITVIFCLTIIGVCLILSGRKGKVIVEEKSDEGKSVILEVDKEENKA